MPLFGSKTTSPPPAQTTTTTTTSPTRRSMFSRRRSSSVSSLERSNNTGLVTKRHSVLHRHGEDASIASARTRVMEAEAAEREADRALFAARAAVRDAREQVKRLEREAAEEARLAKIKQKQAHQIGKRGKALGRHDHI